MNFNSLKVADLLDLNSDLIIQFNDHEGIIKNIHLSEKFIQDFSVDHFYYSLKNLIQYYIYSKKPIQILKVSKYKKTKYEWVDFEIQELSRRMCGSYLIIYVNIENKKTGVIFEDWVRPIQIESIDMLNNLIFWDTEGEEVFFQEEIKTPNQIEKKELDF